MHQAGRALTSSLYNASSLLISPVVVESFAIFRSIGAVGGNAVGSVQCVRDTALRNTSLQDDGGGCAHPDVLGSVSQEVAVSVVCWAAGVKCKAEVNKAS